MITHSVMFCCCIMVRSSCVLTSLGFPDVGSSSVWLLSIPNMEKLPSSLAMYGVTECQSFLLLFLCGFG